MIARAIGIAQCSGLFDHIVVSTDDKDMAGAATECGAEVPFARPAEPADDHAPTVPVIAHAVGTCQALDWQVDQVCCTYPAVRFLKDSVPALWRGLHTLGMAQPHLRPCA